MDSAQHPSRDRVPATVPAAQGRRTRRVEQPIDIINVPGALLKISTLTQLSGRSASSLYRDEKAGLLTVTRHGVRCARVSSENARAYLARLAGGEA
ncbi:MAG: hypothetical protein J7598_03520 [Mitsuaria chitosanitabida]|uniref:hypothetical protein n=1 Tax=Roseateles chitosanitabidus TaxID=65048 RepID=UPI001B0C955E|nr:hypothetical protein [Roseateles chitosanitabidus]MBO9685659.1 hypothetical protein [Roseateles chitosanitabidus]